MNKFIRIEWVPFDRLLSSWMLRHPWAKTLFKTMKDRGPYRLLSRCGDRYDNGHEGMAMFLPSTRLAAIRSVHQDVSEVIFSWLFLLITFKQVFIQVPRSSRIFFREYFILHYIITQAILAFWLVLAYDLLEDRRTIDVIITKFFPLLFLNGGRFGEFG